MTPHSPIRRTHARRRLVERALAFIAAAVVVGGLPLVAQALDSETAAQAADPVGVVATWPPVGPIIPVLGANLEEAVRLTEPAPAPTPPTEPPAPVLPDGTTAEQWAALRQCESGGDYAITNPSGAYRGAYQFDRSTWNSVAQRHNVFLVGVDPAAASPADQDFLAYALYGERGSSPWPRCGRALP
jgi:hypothetical protein